MSEDEYTAVMGRGTAAAALLTDDTLTAALKAVEDDILAEFRQLAPGSVGLMAAAHARLKALDDVPAKLRAWSDDAKKAAHHVERRNRR